MREHTSTLVQYSMHAWCCCCSLPLSSSSDIPAAHAHPTVEMQRTCTRTDSGTPTCFHVYAVWPVNTVHNLAFFPLRAALCSANPYTVCIIIQHQPSWELVNIQTFLCDESTSQLLLLHITGLSTWHTRWGCNELDLCAT